MSAAKRLDFTMLYSVCGDPSSHIAEALSVTSPGEKIEVVYRKGDMSVEESLKLVEESGLASVEEKSCEGEVCKAVLVRRG